MYVDCSEILIARIFYTVVSPLVITDETVSLKFGENNFVQKRT